jgi:hypothetical protein
MSTTSRVDAGESQASEGRDRDDVEARRARQAAKEKVADKRTFLDDDGS